MFVVVNAIGCTETGTRVVLNSLLLCAPKENTYVVNAIGCTETGTRVVLNSLLLCAPKENTYVVITTKSTERSLNRTLSVVRPDIFVIGLNRLLFGVALRVFFEFFVSLLPLLRLASIVNLSHYGLCFGGNFSLYIHSPELMHFDSDGFGSGKSNFIKRYMLVSCIKNASSITVQTPSMRLSLLQFCRRFSCSVPASLNTLTPELPHIKVSTPPTKLFKTQLFYPASNFPHKRSDLAIAASELYCSKKADAGLVITTTGLSTSNQICELGRISHDEVFSYYSGSDALLFTSEKETLGLPILEAMQFSLPIIVPRLPYAEDLLGDAGCYYETSNRYSVCQAIDSCISNMDYWREKINSRRVFLSCKVVSWEQHWDYLLDF